MQQLLRLVVVMKMEPKMSSVYRVVFLGAPGVGKTSIIQRCVCNEFKDKYSPTIEEMYFYKLALPGKWIKDYKKVFQKWNKA